MLVENSVGIFLYKRKYGLLSTTSTRTSNIVIYTRCSHSFLFGFKTRFQIHIKYGSTKIVHQNNFECNKKFITQNKKILLAK